MEEKFLLVSLEEDKAKKLAQVISNDTARKILDFLSDKDATESELAKALKIPLSTIHYNMKQMVDAKLVTDDKYTYSEKGKEIIHYSLANKYVIIAPKNTEGIKDKLKLFLPVLGLSAGAAYLVNLFKAVSLENLSSAKMMAAPMMMDESADMAVAEFSRTVAQIQPVTNEQNLAIWFLFGSIFALVAMFIWSEYVKKKK